MNMSDGRRETHAVENIVSRTALLDISTSEVRAETHFPGHLVEKIVARIPFPDILKARLLSKHWKSKFSYVARQSFLHCPQYFSYWCESEIVGYDAVSNSVRRIAVCRGKVKSDREQAFSCGPLLAQVILDAAARSLEVTVTNVFTQKRKKVVWSINCSNTWYELFLVPVGTKHYELMIWYNWYYYCEDHGVLEENTTLAVYNSDSCKWTKKSYQTDKVVQNAAYKDGALYYVTGDQREPSVLHGGFAYNRESKGLRLVCLNIQGGVCTETPIPVEGEVTLYFTVRCGSDIITVITDSGNLIVSQLDTELSALVEVSRTLISKEDSDRFARYKIQRYGASGNRLYITAFTSETLEEEETPLLFIYKVDSKTWSRSYVPQELRSRRMETYPHFVLEPGLNPFLEP